MTAFFSVLAALIALGGYIPYARDILRGRARPARSARIMFAILLVISLVQQHSLGSGWLLAMTLGEMVGSLAILALALNHGVGGFSKIDKVCYTLLIADLIIWQATGNTLLALHLGVLADLIAFSPTLIKTWHKPWTETPVFFITGIIAPTLNIVAAGKYSYAVLLFPAYIAIVNLIETILIFYRQATVARV